MAAGKFYNHKMVRNRATEVLSKFAAQTGVPISIPVPVERIAEDLFEFNILWEPIPEELGQTILAGLVPTDRLIVFNESRRTLFDDTSFLYNTVLAHEIGHWQLHVDHHTLEHPVLPGFDRPFYIVCWPGSDSWEEHHAHWFSSNLLLPRDLLATCIDGLEIRSLSDMYRVRDHCQVTITVLRIALEQMGRGYVGEDGRVYPSKQEYQGQLRLL